MSVYLNEVCVGKDANVVGFPHLLLCMGLVYVTADKLYGVHLTSTDKTDALVTAFNNWLTTEGADRGSAKSLYGSGNLVVRYGRGDGLNKWKTEMRGIADKLGFRGPVCGFDTSIIAPKDGTFVEYHKSLSGFCKIFYKRNEKMNFGRYGPSENLGKITVTGKIRTDVEVDMPHEAAVRFTKSNQGQLHEVDYARRLMSFIHA